MSSGVVAVVVIDGVTADTGTIFALGCALSPNNLFVALAVFCAMLTYCFFVCVCVCVCIYKCIYI